MTYRNIECSPCWACDTFGGVSSPSVARALAADFRAIGLYPAVTTAEELQWVTDAGLGVWWILEGLATTTMPSAEVGRALAENAVRRLAAFGVPPGATVFLDLEDASGPIPEKSQGWIDMANTAADVLVAMGHICGAYVGAGLGLNAQQIFELKANRYWKSASRVPEPECGWCMIQGYPTDVKHYSGAQIDCDAVWRDYRGRTITVTVAG